MSSKNSRVDSADAAVSAARALTRKTVSQIKEEIKQRLKDVSKTPKLEAEMLLEHFLRMPKHRQIIEGEELATEDLVTIETLVELLEATQKRENHTPLAYILGYKWFYKKKFYLNEHTFIPRPDTEILVEHALRVSYNRLNSGDFDKTKLRVLDLCTGSGAISISIAEELEEKFGRDRFEVYALDISQAALKIAAKNDSKKLVHFLNKDVCKLENSDYAELAKFDLIISNPPYIPEPDTATWQLELNYEPQHALTSGKDGMDVYSSIFTHLPHLLSKQGIFLGEIYPENARFYENFAKRVQFEIGFLKGLAEENRFMSLRWPNYTLP
ncbi:MAG: peptide chain release factor N(5)-glutamine methyltransferase [Candidatus Dojkabacteria bacterium]